MRAYSVPGTLCTFSRFSKHEWDGQMLLMCPFYRGENYVWRSNDLPEVPQLVAANPGLSHPKVSGHTDDTLPLPLIQRSHWGGSLHPWDGSSYMWEWKCAALNFPLYQCPEISAFHFLHTASQLKHIQQTAHSFQLHTLVNQLTGLPLHLQDLPEAEACSRARCLSWESERLPGGSKVADDVAGN